MGAVENNRKHDDLFEWDPWVQDFMANKELANQWKHGSMYGMYA